MTLELLYRRPDGTFVAQVNGNPYHVVEGDEPRWGEAQSAAEALGDALPFEPAPPTPPVTVDTYRAAIRAHVDTTARRRSYDSAVTCASYVNSTFAVWAAEGSVFVAWRDAVWAHAYTELAKVEAGQRPQPTVEAIVAELPEIEWPN